MNHDPIRRTRDFQQALTPDKIPVGFFLGAGCPLAIRVGSKGESPLIPDVAGLTKYVCDELCKDTVCKKHHTDICKQLTADGNDKPNIEHLLSHIRSLKQAAGKRDACGLTAKELDDLDSKICALIDGCVRKRLPTSGTPYHRLASWISAITRQHSVELFTTNYDLLIEQALEETRVPYFDGFVGSDRTFFDPPSMELDSLPARWAKLWKLHGSINWRQDEKGVVSRGEDSTGYTRRLIHPSHLKYDESRKMPYLAMIDRLKGFLKKSPSVLVICGYSFSDQHLNEVLHQELQGNAKTTCFALLYGKLADYPDAISLAQHRPNLTLLSRDSAMVGTRQAEWSVPKDADLTAYVTAFEIVKVKPTSGDDIEECNFRLGDFGQLGEFLARLMGTTSSNGDSWHA